jgi:hypothetical protein
MNQVSPETPAKRVDVIASRSMQAQLRARCSYKGFCFPDDGVVSQETQQLDQVKELDSLIAHHENIQRLMKAEKPTGVPHLFVLDAEQLAVGDLEAQLTLQALANSKFNDSFQAAVAMLPPDSGFTPAGKLSASLIKDTVLLDAGVATLESVSALDEWLSTR